MRIVHPPIPPEHERVVWQCIGSAIRVHRGLGPGYREIIYKRAYCLELDSRGIKFECEKEVLVRYRDWLIPGQKLDLIVAGVVLVEIKSVPRLCVRHEKQILSYLKTTNLRVGLLLNFNARLMRDGLKRFVN
jgi:GxxExxY protein